MYHIPSSSTLEDRLPSLCFSKSELPDSTPFYSSRFINDVSSLSIMLSVNWICPTTFLIQGASIFLGMHDWKLYPNRKSWLSSKIISGLGKSGKGIEIFRKIGMSDPIICPEGRETLRKGRKDEIRLVDFISSPMSGTHSSALNFLSTNLFTL